jgi:hypothetical protein
MKKLFVFLFILAIVPVTFGQIVPKFGLGISAGVVFPQSDMSNVYKTGYGGNLTVILPIPGPFEFSASVGYYGFKFNNDYLNDLYRTQFNTQGNFNIEAPMSMIPITANARYYFTPALVRPYGEVNLGISLASIKVTIPDPIPGDPFRTLTSEASETKQYIGIGAGIVVGIGVVANLDVNLRYVLLGHDFGTEKTITSGGSTTIESSKSKGSYFGASVGVRVKL